MGSRSISFENQNNSFSLILRVEYGSNNHDIRNLGSMRLVKIIARRCISAHIQSNYWVFFRTPVLQIGLIIRFEHGSDSFTGS